MILNASTPLPWRPRRVLVAGVSGSGKSTLARRISEVGRLPYTEIDSLYHGPDWRPRAEFPSEVMEFITQPEWVIEWQYKSVKNEMLAAADTMVWLNLSRRTVYPRLMRRTLLRRVRRTELWNGNAEPPLHTLFTDPNHVVRFSWRSYPLRAAQFRELSLSLDPQRIALVDLRSPADVRDWLRGPFSAQQR